MGGEIEVRIKDETYRTTFKAKCDTSNRKKLYEFLISMASALDVDFEKVMDKQREMEKEEISWFRDS
jgi:hypothetical protein